MQGDAPVVLYIGQSGALAVSERSCDLSGGLYQHPPVVVGKVALHCEGLGGQIYQSVIYKEELNLIYHYY